MSLTAPAATNKDDLVRELCEQHPGWNFSKAMIVLNHLERRGVMACDLGRMPRHVLLKYDEIPRWFVDGVACGRHALIV